VLWAAATDRLGLPGLAGLRHRLRDPARAGACMPGAVIERKPTGTSVGCLAGDMVLSPTVYRTDRGSWLVQGWVVTDPEALGQMSIPEGETCVEIPDRMVQFFRQEDRDPGIG
jgi:hypothetical protein